jgi:predicted permease
MLLLRLMKETHREAFLGDLVEEYRGRVLPMWGDRRARRWLHRQIVVGVAFAVVHRVRDGIGAAAAHMGEVVQPGRGEGRMIDWVGTLRVAGRSLARRPAFAAGVVLTMGVGIGATAGVYAVVDNVVIRPLPYGDADELVAIGTLQPTDGSVAPAGLQPLSPMPWVNVRALAERSRALESVAALSSTRFPVPTGDGGSEFVGTASVTPGFFDLLGAGPALGRGFVEDDFSVRSGEVALLSHGYWERRYGADPAILGQPLESGPTRWDFLSHTVVGVLPADFIPPEAFFPEGEAPDVFLPYHTDRGEGNYYLSSLDGVLGRLAPGAGLDIAREEVSRIAGELASEYPQANVAADGLRREIGVNPLHSYTVGASEQPLWIFLAAAALLALLSALNAATLLLARALDRVPELGVHAAMGATRPQIIRVLLAEAGLLTLAGAVVGVGIAAVGVESFVRFAPSVIPRLHEVSLDGRVLGVMALVTIGTGLLAALLPAVKVTRSDPWNGLRRGGSRVAGASHSGLRAALVGGQLALAMVLLSGAALLFSSFVRIRATPPGFDPDGLISMTIRSNQISRGSRAAAWEGWASELDILRAVPGVVSVSGSSGLPFRAPTWTPRFAFPGDGADVVREGIAGYAVTPDYFSTMGIDVIDGRAFEGADAPDSEPVAVVSESFVRSYLGDTDPLGQIVRRFEGSEVLPARIVGVVDDVAGERIDSGSQAALYLPHTQAVASGAPSTMWAVVRSEAPAAAVTRDLRRSLAEAGRMTLTMDVMVDRMAATRTTPRFQAMLSGAFGAIATLLAAMGLYGLLGHSIRSRRSELGLRMALGADRSTLLWMVLRQGMALAAAGMVLGLALTLAFSGVLRSFLYDLEPTDPMTLGLVASVMLLVSAAACIGPARRATAVEPVKVLGAE